MGVKISELDSYTAVKENDLIPIVDIENEGTKKITINELFKYIKAGEGISINDDGTIKLNNTVYKKPFIKVKTDRQRVNTTGSYGEVAIPLGNKEVEGNNEDNQLTVSGNAIKIGQGISVIEVCAHTRGISYYETTGDKELMLIKNNQSVEGFYQTKDSGYMGADINTLLNVQEGDLISLKLSSQNSGQTEILEGYLQIKVVK